MYYSLNTFEFIAQSEKTIDTSLPVRYKVEESGMTGLLITDKTQHL